MGEITSTAQLLSEFGLFGVVIDPVIAQVAVGITGIAATLDDGSGPQPAVRHQHVVRVQWRAGKR